MKELQSPTYRFIRLCNLAVRGLLKLTSRKTVWVYGNSTSRSHLFRWRLSLGVFLVAATDDRQPCELHLIPMVFCLPFRSVPSFCQQA